MKKIILTLLFAAIVVLASAQEAAYEESVQYDNISSNFSTGAPNVNIPIWTATSLSLSTPVALGYATNGIRVTDAPGEVGLGWELVAGGEITQIVRSKNDFEVAMQYNISDKLAEITGESNIEQDLYSINAPGISATFFIDSTGRAKTMSQTNLKISFIKNQGLQDSKFIVTDENGNRFTFDRLQMIYAFGAFFNTVVYEPTGIECAYYRSKWLLTKIENYNKTDEIIFEYNHQGQNYETQKLCTGRILTGNETYTETATDQIKLTKIKTKTQELLFNISDINTQGYQKYKNHYQLAGLITNSSEYTDIDKVLKTIIIKDINGNVLRDYKFTYELGGQDFDFNNRIFLKTITQSDGGENGGKKLPPYEFSYININSMPSIYNTEYDYWGFYNGTQDIRYPVADFLSNGMLRSINYPSGKSSYYEYEPNTYLFPSKNPEDPWYCPLWKNELDEWLGNEIQMHFHTNPDSIVVDTLYKLIFDPKFGNRIDTIWIYMQDTTFTDLNNRISLIGPGVRVKKISNYKNSLDNAPLVSELDYEDENGSFGRMSYYPILSLSDAPRTGLTIKSLYSQNIEPSFIGYKKVISYQGGKSENQYGKNGRIEYNFSSIATYSELEIDGVIPPIDSILIKNKYWVGIVGLFPFPLKIFPRQANGILLWQDVFDKLNKLVSTQTYNYKIDAEDQENSYLAGYRLYRRNQSGNYTSIGGYRVYPLRIRLDSVCSRQIIDGNPNDFFTTTTTFNYQRGGFISLKPLSVTSQESNGDIVRNEFFYPQDDAYKNQAVYVKMIEKNIIAPQVEKQVFKNNGLLSGSKTNLVLLTNGADTLIAPQNAQQWIDGSYQTHSFFDSYDFKTGRLLQAHGRDLINTVTLYAYKRSLPVASITNLNYQAISGIIDVESLAASTDNTFIESTLNTLRQTINNNYPQAFISTSLYQPLVGKLKETDTNGRSVSYEYDNLGRLTTVRDQNGVIKQYKEYQLVK